MAKADKGTFLVVAAFDVGNTNSGYAFSFRDDPMNVKPNQAWVAGSGNLISLKTPTCVLLDPAGQFSAFGFEAENKYSSLVDDDEHRGWRLFRRFKMMLHLNAGHSPLSTMIDDINGTSMQALPIFSMAIRFLREHLLRALIEQFAYVDETDIQYVITVPAIWDDDTKQFMTEAAIEAGMDSERLRLVLEPEAALIWCEQINPDVRIALAGQNTQCMVVDLGGAANFSVLEKNDDGSFKEMHSLSGGPWGGAYVEEGYFTFLDRLFGKDTIHKLKTDEMSYYFDILREFETRKRTFSSTTTNKITFQIHTLSEMSKDSVGQTLKQRLASMNFGDRIVLRGDDRLRVDPEIIRKWFDAPVNCIIEHIKSLLSETKNQRVQTILLVGGFGECQYVQERMKTELKHIRLVAPDDARLVVLKGAVRFGATALL